VQVISWNDYGESHYIGPIGADQPNSQAWVDGFDHEAWLDMTAVYARAFKAGTPPQIAEDHVFLTSRPHPAGAGAPDGLGKPTGWDWEESADYLQAVVFATQPATFTLRAGGNAQSFSVPAGVSKVRVPSAPGTIQGTLVRGGQTVVDVAPGADKFAYTDAPSRYNFNAYVAGGKA
jgi:glucan endo-1,3-alpha-glucosidase